VGELAVLVAVSLLLFAYQRLRMQLILSIFVRAKELHNVFVLSLQELNLHIKLLNLLLLSGQLKVGLLRLALIEV
jgi:hypothetical protein